MPWQGLQAGLTWPPQKGGTAGQVLAHELQCCADLIFELQEGCVVQGKAGFG